MFSRNVCILLLVGFVMSVSGCLKSSDVLGEDEQVITNSAYSITSEDSSEIEQEDCILDRSNNTSSVDDLITTTYPKELLLENYVDKMYNYIEMTEINSQCKIECIRKINDQKYYTVQKSSEGGILYSLFTKSDDAFKLGGDISDLEKTVIVNWYVEDSLKKEEFDKIKISSSTLDDVKKIDPYGFYPVDLAPYRGRTLDYEESHHLTTDGYSVDVIYEGYENKYIVKDIKIDKADKYSLYEQLLPMDKPDKLLK